MKCPTCAIDLLMTDRQGVEIDYCPQCRGVWLDRGELDKLIERAIMAQPATSVAPDRARGDEARRDDIRRDEIRSDLPRRYDRDDDDDDYRRRKRKSFLGELFDF